MVSLRKLFPIVASLVLATGIASAVTINCIPVGSTTNVLRAEGKTEPIANITYACTPGAAVPAATDFTLQLFVGGGVTVTSQDASVTAGTHIATATVGADVNLGIVSGNSITWTGVNIPAGAGNFNIVLSNLLIDASMIPTGGTIGINVLAASSNSGNVDSAIFGAAPGSPISQLANVAIALKSLNVTNTAGGTVFAATDSTAKTVKIPKCAVFTKFSTEKPTTDPDNAAAVLTTIKYTGILSSSFPANPTTGQRLTYTISNLPAGVGLWVPNKIVVSHGTAPVVIDTEADLVLGYGADLSGGYLASVVSGSDIYTKLPASGTAVYQISVAPATASTEISLSVFAQAENPTATTALTTISAGYAPVGTSAIPRFAAGGIVATDLIHLTDCTTTLFFPYVVVGGGYDTGLAVANAGSDVTDPTSALDGKCVFTFNGDGAPTATHDLTVKAGQTNAFDLLTAYPTGNFSGYAVAACNFQGGAGYTFVVNSKGSTASYLPMVQ